MGDISPAFQKRFQGEGRKQAGFLTSLSPEAYCTTDVITKGFALDFLPAPRVCGSGAGGRGCRGEARLARAFDELAGVVRVCVWEL